MFILLSANTARRGLLPSMTCRRRMPSARRSSVFDAEGNSRLGVGDAVGFGLLVGHRQEPANAAGDGILRQRRVGVVTEDGVMRITINDNGRGFHPDAAHGGFGLDSMRERAALIGATLAISSQPQDGSRVELRLPLAHREGTDGN